MPRDHAGKAATLRRAGNVDELPDGKRVGTDDVTRLELRELVRRNAKLFQQLTRFCARFHWTIEERTQARYNTAVENKYMEKLGTLKSLFPVIPGCVKVEGNCQVLVHDFDPVRTASVNTRGPFMRR